MKKLKTWIIWGFVLAVAGLGFALMERDPGEPVRTAPVKLGEIHAYVEDRAKTTLPDPVHVFMPISGRVLPIELEPGAKVAKGDVVARLDPSDLDSEIAIASADLDRINAEIEINQYLGLENTALAEAKGWISALTTTAESADEVIKAQQANKGYTDWWLKAVKDLKMQGAMADEKLRKAEMDDAQANVDLATSKLTSQAMWTVKSIFDLGPKFVTEYLVVKAMRTQVLSMEKTAAETRLAKIKRDRGRCEIASPVSGVILERFEKSEHALPAGAKLLEIGDLEHLEVTAEILSQEASRIKPGDNADIFGEAIGELPLRGTVKRVDPQGFTKQSSLGVDEQRVNVVVNFAPDDLQKLTAAGRSLGALFRVQIRIYTAHDDKALIVPRMALFQDNAGAWNVYAVQNGRAVLTPVKTGLMNENQAQILSGLDENAAVIVAPPKTLAPGAKVRAERGEE